MRRGHTSWVLSGLVLSCSPSDAEPESFDASEAATDAGDEGGSSSTTGDGEATTAGDGDDTSTGDGDGDATSGDGDGDGDGDGNTGDGDGSGGDGDGDGSSGDGDGDGTTGDGDGDGVAFRYAFVTEQEVSPGTTVSGLYELDMVCQQEADAAGLPGTYLAWASDTASFIPSWPADRFVHSAVPYRTPDGTQIAADWAELTSGSLASPLNRNADGGFSVANPAVFTGTQADGTVASGGNCWGWLQATGFATAGQLGGLAGWSEFMTVPCSFSTAIYCFQQ